MTFCGDAVSATQSRLQQLLEDERQKVARYSDMEREYRDLQLKVGALGCLRAHVFVIASEIVFILIIGAVGGIECSAARCSGSC